MLAPPNPRSVMVLLPNALSALRLGIAAVFPVVPPPWWLPLVLAGAASDGLDGWIARRWRATSILGGLLDGIADKAFALSVLGTLLGAHRLTWAQVVAVLLRDVVVAGIAAFFLLRRQWLAFEGMPSRWSGKSATVLLFGWFVALLWPLPAGVSDLLFALAALASLWGAVDYVREFVHAVRDGRVRVFTRAGLPGD